MAAPRLKDPDLQKVMQDSYSKSQRKESKGVAQRVSETILENIPEVSPLDLLSLPAQLLLHSGNAEASLVRALPNLKGMPGVHTGYDLAKAKTILTKHPNLAKAVEKKYGVISTPEGLKTDISDKGFKLKSGAEDKLLDLNTYSFEDIFEHPNIETIKAATRDPNLTQNINVRGDPYLDALGSYRPSEDLVKLNPQAINADKAKYINYPTAVEGTGLHEFNHAIQQRMGFQGGSSPKAAAATKEVQKQLKLLADPRIKSQENAVNQLLSKTYPESKIAKMTREQKEEYVSDLILSKAYRSHAGEQSAEAASLRHILSSIEPDVADIEITSPGLMMPIGDQIYKP